MGKSLSAPANWCAANEEPRGKLRGIQSEPGYSPHWDVIEISSNRVLGVEALLRWKRDGQTSISPAEFIPLAEESGLIIPIGEWVLHTACVQAQAWHKGHL